MLTFSDQNIVTYIKITCMYSFPVFNTHVHFTREGGGGLCGNKNEAMNLTLNFNVVSLQMQNKDEVMCFQTVNVYVLFAKWLCGFPLALYVHM
jgi:hypothetical protein